MDERRFFDQGLTGPAAALAQTAKRWTRLSVETFKPDDPAWLALVKAIESHLVLARARPKDLVGCRTTCSSAPAGISAR